MQKSPPSGKFCSYKGSVEFRDFLPRGVLTTGSSALATVSPSVFVGRYTIMQEGVFALKVLAPTSQLVVGSFCSIAEGAEFLMAGEHPLYSFTTSSWGPMALEEVPASVHCQVPKELLGKTIKITDVRGPITLGNDVWIGRNALVLSGVTIGDGAVVGAKALVTKDVPPYAIVGGVPAKIIRYRFSEAQIAKFLKIKWWDWPEDIIKTSLPLLRVDDIEKFFQWADHLKAQGLI